MEKAHTLRSFKELGTMFNLNNGAELTRATKGGIQLQEESIPEAPDRKELERRSKRFESIKPANKLIDAIFKDAQDRKHVSVVGSREFNAVHGISHLHDQETMPEDGILQTPPMPEKNKPEQAKVVPINTKTPPHKVEVRPSVEVKENEQILKIIEGQVAHWEQKLLRQSTDTKNPKREQNRQDYLDFQSSPYGWLNETLNTNTNIPHAKETLRALDVAFKKGLLLPLERTEDMAKAFPAVGTEITDKEIVDAFNRKLGTQSSEYTVEQIFQRRNDQFVTLRTNDGKKFQIKIEDYNWETQPKEQGKFGAVKEAVVETVATPEIITEAGVENEEDEDLETLFEKLKSLREQKEKLIAETVSEITTDKEHSTITPIIEDATSKENLSQLQFIRKKFDPKVSGLKNILSIPLAKIKEGKEVVINKIENFKTENAEKRKVKNLERTRQQVRQTMEDALPEIERDMFRKPMMYLAAGRISDKNVLEILKDPTTGLIDFTKYGGNRHEDGVYKVPMQEIVRINDTEGIIECNTLGFAIIATNCNDPAIKTIGDAFIHNITNQAKNFKILSPDGSMTEGLTYDESNKQYGKKTRMMTDALQQEIFDKVLANKRAKK